jgi:cephalosporin hydroxylase
MNPHDPKDPAKIESMAADRELAYLAKKLFVKSCEYKYSYNFSWLGRPIIQFPQDIVAMQEIVWRLKPDLIIETGIAHGGSLIFHASMLELIGGAGRVLGIDVEIRPHNRVEIEKHPMYKRIDMIEGSSIDLAVVEQVRIAVEQVRARSTDKGGILVVLDSNHTHEHVSRELELYSTFVSKGGYLVVLDTVVEDMPEDFFPDRRWGKGNNPKTAVRQFLKTNDRFAIDKEIEDKLLITVAPNGYLRCVKD